jgi:hypothetical protein
MGKHKKLKCRKCLKEVRKDHAKVHACFIHSKTPDIFEIFEPVGLYQVAENKNGCGKRCAKS